MKKKYQSVLILVILCTILLLYLFTVDMIVVNILEYTELFLKKIFPVSFIFFTVSNLLIEYNFIQFFQQLFKVKSPFIFAFLLSLISGFPSGAIYTKEMLDKGIINVKDANKIIMFTHFPNPLFVINSIGIILNSKFRAYILLLSIILSNFIIFLVLNNKNSSTALECKDNNDFSLCLTNSIIRSIKCIVIVYGISVFFFLIATFLNKIVDNTYYYVIINGIFDLTKGIYSTTLISNIFIRSLFIIIFITFGSLSIHFQIKSILSDTNINYNNFIFGRILSCILTIIIFFIMMLL